MERLTKICIHRRGTEGAEREKKKSTSAISLRSELRVEDSASAVIKKGHEYSRKYVTVITK